MVEVRDPGHFVGLWWRWWVLLMGFEEWVGGWVLAVIVLDVGVVVWTGGCGGDVVHVLGRRVCGCCSEILLAQWQVSCSWRLYLYGDLIDDMVILIANEVDVFELVYITIMRKRSVAIRPLQ